MKVNERLVELRLKNKLKQWQVANYCHVHRSTYSGYERGKTKIPVDVIISLSRLYQVSVDYLLGLTNKESTNKKDY